MNSKLLDGKTFAINLFKKDLKSGRLPIPPILDGFGLVCHLIFEWELLPPTAPASNDAIEIARFRDRKERHERRAQDTQFPAKLEKALRGAFDTIAKSLPSSCFISTDEFRDYAPPQGFELPLYALLKNPNQTIHDFIKHFTTNDIFTGLKILLKENQFLYSQKRESKKPLTPMLFDGSPSELVDTYFNETILRGFFLTSVPFAIPLETRFSGHWIIAPSGRGKTTLLQTLFLDDVRQDASIIVLDAKGEFINKIKKLKMAQDRLVLIEPDPNHPIALNPLDLPRTNITQLVDNLEYLFSALLETNMTPLQQTLFRSVLRGLIIAFPNPTLETFRDLIANGYEPYTNYIKKLPEDLQTFFFKEFSKKMYDGTREQVIWRLRLLLENDTVRTMFNAPSTKLNIANEMDAGKIIVVDNSKERLGDQGSEFFGRFFVAQVLSAAQARSSRAQKDKKPCFFYIDECQNVIRRDGKIPIILDECRSQKIAIILAHQRTEQIESKNVLSALGNCAIRMANSDDEAPYLSDKLRTDVDFLRGLHKGVFATFVRDMTPTAIALYIPMLDLDTYPQMTSVEQQALREKMHLLYGTTQEIHKPSQEGLGVVDEKQLEEPVSIPTPPVVPPRPADSAKSHPPPKESEPNSEAPEAGPTW